MLITICIWVFFIFFMMSEVVVAIQEEETLDDIFLTIYY